MKLNLLKKPSLDSQFSQFTLASTKKNIFVNQEKENIANNKMHNISKVKIDKEPDDINYNISNINHEGKFKRDAKKRNSCSIKTNKNIFKNKSIEETHKAQLLSSYKGNSNNPKNTNQLDIYKQLHISSSHLFMKEDAKKYAELLEIIIELYKNKKISLEQKIKLKKLTVCRSPKILNIYNYFNYDNEKFIKELKQIIQ
jgi:predicted HTH domain antitoxin